MRVVTKRHVEDSNKCSPEKLVERYSSNVPMSFNNKKSTLIKNNNKSNSKVYSNRDSSIFLKTQTKTPKGHDNREDDANNSIVGRSFRNT